MLPFIRNHKILSSLFVAAIVLALAAAVAPWKSVVESKLKSLLEGQGGSSVRLSLSTLDLSGATLSDIAFQNADMNVAIKNIEFQGALLPFEKRWSGAWRMNEAQIKSDALALSAFDGEGTVSFSLERGFTKRTEGRLRAADRSFEASFETTYVLNDPDASSLTLTSFEMPWSEGVLSAKNVRIPIGKEASIDINLTVDRVSADAVLRQLTGQRASATGKISGLIPMTLKPDGSVVFHNGFLRAEEPGTLRLSPDVVPGDNEQVALVRDVLNDLHYAALSFSLNTDKEGRISLRMKIEGHNPQVQQGRPVKMNVNLTGDMLDFVRQNMNWLRAPQKMMEQGRNETP